MKPILFALILGLFLSGIANAQMKRERVNPGGPVQKTFWAPSIVGMATVEQLERQNLNATIMHSFGIATRRPIQNFFGLDNAFNVRIGLDYGISDNWSVGMGRSTSDKIVDFRTKLALIRQNKSDTWPLSLSLKGDVGVVTLENRQPFSEDLSFLVAVPLARKFSDRLSLQVSPMYAHFNAVNRSIGQHHNLYALGLGGEYHISKRFALSMEYYPVIGKRNKGTHNAFSLAVDIETGGHVFQMFFASSSRHTEQHIIAYNRDQFLAGDFRFGFTINRLFYTGKK